MRYVGRSTDRPRALGTFDGEGRFYLGGEAVISCYLRSLSFSLSIRIYLISSEQNRQSRPTYCSFTPAAWIYALRDKIKSAPRGSLIDIWSMAMMMRTETMLSCPELLIDNDKVITLCSIITIDAKHRREVDIVSSSVFALGGCLTLANTVRVGTFAKFILFPSTTVGSISIYDSG